MLLAFVSRTSWNFTEALKKWRVHYHMFQKGEGGPNPFLMNYAVHY